MYFNGHFSVIYGACCSKIMCNYSVDLRMILGTTSIHFIRKIIYILVFMLIAVEYCMYKRKKVITVKLYCYFLKAVCVCVNINPITLITAVLCTK